MGEKWKGFSDKELSILNAMINLSRKYNDDINIDKKLLNLLSVDISMVLVSKGNNNDVETKGEPKIDETGDNSATFSKWERFETNELQALGRMFRVIEGEVQMHHSDVEYVLLVIFYEEIVKELYSRKEKGTPENDTDKKGAEGKDGTAR